MTSDNGNTVGRFLLPASGVGRGDDAAKKSQVNSIKVDALYQLIDFVWLFDLGQHNNLC